ncbi:MAG: pseudomurein-binding repeat-containing protein [Methanobacteriaceae archaeon]|nr:pseudomurein-binding repeat-containing protein [Methanobacteriaceae archaeon]
MNLNSKKILKSSKKALERLKSKNSIPSNVKTNHVKKFSLISILIITAFITLSPVAGGIFVTDSSHGIMTAPAAAHTNNQLILSSLTPEKSVLNYLTGQNTMVVGNLKISGTKISARTSSLSKYWSTSNVVILTTGSDISATYLAIKNNAPLLISGKTLPSATKTEINRLKAKKIIICGSKTSIPDSSLSSLKNIKKTRIWYGSDALTFKTIQKSYLYNIKVTAPKSLMPVAMATWKSARFEISDKLTVAGKTIWSPNTATTSIALNKYSKKDLPNIYLTSDSITGTASDKELMIKIKNAIAGSANVIIDPSSPGSNEASRAIKNAPNGIAAYIAAACPGTIYDIVTGVKTGYLKSDASDLKGIVFINYGKTNLGTASYLGRSWDDNFSNVYFAGIYSPSQYIQSSGISLIEPRVGTSTEDQRVSKIASSLIYSAYYANKEHLSTSDSTATSALIAKHQINPTTLSSDAQRIINGQNTTMDRANWIYLSSQYIAGLPITNSAVSMSDSSASSASTFSGTLNRTEYKDAAARVYAYMKTNKKAPSSVTVKGKTLNINDYSKMFAKVIYKHTEKKYMTFPASVSIKGSILDNTINYLQNLMG